MNAFIDHASLWHREAAGLPVLLYQRGDTRSLGLGDELLKEEGGTAVATCARRANSLLH